MKYIGILALSLTLVACKSEAPQEEIMEDVTAEVVTEKEESKPEEKEYSFGNQPMKPRGQNYICQTARPGLSIEYMQIALNETETGIEGMWYFDSQMEEPARQIIHQQSFDLDKNVLTGTYSYPGAKEVISFKLKGKRFTSTYDGMVDHYDLQEY